MADANEQASRCAERIQADFEAATVASAQVTGMYEAMQSPEVRAVRPAAPIDIDAMLATSGAINPVAPQSPPVGRLASISSALRRLLSLRRDRRDRGASR